MTTAFVLCAGLGQRWGNYLGRPKQLLAFGRETLLDRTIRLVRRHDQCRVLVVVTAEDSPWRGFPTMTIGATSTLAESILRTSTQWSTRNIFLLGDVFYSPDAVEAICGARARAMFFGRPWPSAIANCGHGEMFGLSFPQEAAETVAERLRETIRADCTGNLWNLYQIAAELPLGSSEYRPQLLTVIDDFTNDIDCPIDYQRRAGLYETIAMSGD